MLPVSSKQIVEFTPESLAEREPKPVFFLQVATLMARAQWRRALAEEGARLPSQAELLAALRDDLKASGPDNLEQLLDEVDAYEATADADEKLKVAPHMPQMEQWCARLAGAYSRALADRDFWFDLAPVMAAQRFIGGWENVGVPFKAAKSGVDPATLEVLKDKLGEPVIKRVGWRAMELMTLSRNEDAEKNSAAPSGSPESPATSTAA